MTEREPNPNWNELSRDALRRELMAALSSDYLPSLAPDVNVQHYLAELFRASNETVRATFRQTVSDLIDDVTPTDDPHYVAELLALAGRTGASLCRNSLIHILATEQLKSIPLDDNEDLHLRGLRVLGGLTVDEASQTLLIRDIRDPRYAVVCYVALYESRLPDAIRYCHFVVEAAVAAPEWIPLDYVLKRMILSIGVDAFTEGFRNIVGTLDDRHISRFLDALSGFADLFHSEGVLQIDATGLAGKPTSTRIGFFDADDPVTLELVHAMVEDCVGVDTDAFINELEAV